jgi:antitoxin component YwqK of YwqJK toxin-antitoxin module
MSRDLSRRYGLKAKYHYASGFLEKENLYIFKKCASIIIEKWYCNKSGVLRCESTNKNGMKTGKERSYYNSGNLETEAVCIDGLKEGKKFLYYNSGSLEGEFNFAKGEKNGIQRYFYRNGIPTREERYASDLCVSVTVLYNNDGSYLDYAV